jgi:SAM-dependent methyltransferase
LTVFNSLYADSYDQLYASKNYQGECDLIEAGFARYGNSPLRTVLDVGCGTGTHVIELARRGYQMTGVDVSPHMLELAAAKSVDLDLADDPTWLLGDARSFQAKGPYDAAIMMFAVIGYLTGNEDVLSGLRNIRRHLKPGALFMSDFWYGPSVLTDRPTDRVRVLESPGQQVIRASNTKLDIVQQTADVTFRLWTLKNGMVESETTETHSHRYYFPQEYAFFLQQAGFRMENISAFPTLDDPLSDQVWNAFVVARAI